MSRSIPALVKPALLVWARESEGLEVEQVAKKLKLPTAKVATWESGEAHPSLSQVRRLAELYHRPLAVFFLPEPPTSFAAMRDFRRVAHGQPLHLSQQAQFEIRKARQRREVALELLDAQGEAPAEFGVSASLAEDPKVVGERLRAFLGIELATQSQWTGKYDALNGWRRALEDRGALVFHMSGVPFSEARGFSEYYPTLPFVVLNPKEHPVGRVFTLAHELAHLALRAGGVCDLHEDGSISSETTKLEVFCNRVAGYLLVPVDDLRDQIGAVSSSGVREWSDEELAALAARYRVSRQVVLRNLVLLNRAAMAQYLAKHDAYALPDDTTPGKKAPVPFYRKVITWNGRSYSRLLIDAYDNERITGADLSDYLGIKIGYLSKVRGGLKPKAAAEGDE